MIPTLPEPDTNMPKNLYDDTELDPVYYAKTLALNQAIRDVGMGKYQACRVVVAASSYLTEKYPVHAFYCSWVWVVRVSYSSLQGINDILLSDADRDSVWPVYLRFNFCVSLNLIYSLSYLPASFSNQSSTSSSSILRCSV